MDRPQDPSAHMPVTGTVAIAEDKCVNSFVDLLSTTHWFCSQKTFAAQVIPHLFDCECGAKLRDLLKRQIMACSACEEGFLLAAHRFAMDEVKKDQTIMRSFFSLFHMRAIMDAGHAMHEETSVFCEDRGRPTQQTVHLVDEEAVRDTLKVATAVLCSETRSDMSPSAATHVNIHTLPHRHALKYFKHGDSFGSPSDYKDFFKCCLAAELDASLVAETQDFRFTASGSALIIPYLTKKQSGIVRVLCLAEKQLALGDLVAVGGYEEGQELKNFARVPEEGYRHCKRYCWGLLQPVGTDDSASPRQIAGNFAGGVTEFERIHGCSVTNLSHMALVVVEGPCLGSSSPGASPVDTSSRTDWMKNGPVLAKKVTSLVPHIRRAKAVSRFPGFAQTLPREHVDVILNPRWWSRGIHYQAECLVLEMSAEGGAEGSPPADVSATALAVRRLIASDALNPAQADVLRYVTGLVVGHRYEKTAAVSDLFPRSMPSRKHMEAFSCVQGPPGTGKTKLICSVMRMLGSIGLRDGERALVCATSNNALDWLLLQFTKSLKCTDCGKNALDVWRRESRPEKQGALPVCCPGCPPKCLRIGQASLEDAKRFQLEALTRICGATRPEDVVKDAMFVFATMSGAAHRHLDHIPFRVMLVDEAAQQAEVDTIIPLCRPICMSQPIENIVLFGDQKQLPATVLSSAVSIKQALGRSLFERLGTFLFNCGICQDLAEASGDDRPGHLGAPFGKVFLLNKQYRCHPAISQFPMNIFYEGKVLDGVSVEDRKASFHDDQFFRPLVFVDMDMCGGKNGYRQGDAAEERTKENSFANILEVSRVRKILIRLLSPANGNSPGVAPEDVAVCSFYKAQTSSIVCDLASHAASAVGRDLGLEKVDVMTVDSFQGQERDVVILSTVRSNAMSGVGFVGDARRVNVAMTRAKRSLIVFGSQKTLRQDHSTQHTASDSARDSGIWPKFLDHCQSHGLIVSAADL